MADEKPPRINGGPCPIEGCANVARMRGWCSTHYRRWKETGDPLKLLNPPRKYKNISGQRFGNLVAQTRVPKEMSRRNARWVCLCDCGNTTIALMGNLQNGGKKSCGCEQYKRLERVMTKAGYVTVDAPDGHPHAGKRNGRILEHRLVVEQYLGRYLLPTEEVHHKNANRSDNRIENLELWTKSHPSGARVEDHIQWALQLILTYKPELLKEAQ